MMPNKIDTSEWDKLVSELHTIADKSVKAAGAYFKDITPKDTGNAKRNTRTKGKVISAEYDYAGRLDEGYSKQAPRGMSGPTILELEKEIEKRVGRL